MAIYQAALRRVQAANWADTAVLTDSAGSLNNGGRGRDPQPPCLRCLVTAVLKLGAVVFVLLTSRLLEQTVYLINFVA